MDGRPNRRRNKAPFTWQIRVDGRPNGKNKVEFSNPSCVVCTLPKGKWLSLKNNYDPSSGFPISRALDFKNFPTTRNYNHFLWICFTVNFITTFRPVDFSHRFLFLFEPQEMEIVLHINDPKNSNRHIRIRSRAVSIKWAWFLKLFLVLIPTCSLATISHQIQRSRFLESSRETNVSFEKFGVWDVIDQTRKTEFDYISKLWEESSNYGT